MVKAISLLFSGLGSLAADKYVPGGSAARNRGADYVEHLVPPVSTAIRVKQAWWSERSKGMT